VNGNCLLPLFLQKPDKEKPGAVQRNVNLFFEKMKENWEFLPQYFVTSAINKLGREEVLKLVEESNKDFINRPGEK
jgi:GTP-binding protein